MRVIVFAVATTLFIAASQSTSAQTWIEDTFADFNDGTFDASGQNLYATAGGRISTIHRFDLNGDGYHDLVFNSSHDFIPGPPATVYQHAQGRSRGQLGELPVRGATCAAVGDMNKDGYDDLVTCPNHAWVSPRRYALIFWGGEDGWVPHRMTNLLTINPLAVQVGDLNGDSWPELIVLNGSRWAPEDGPEKVLRIYWGSPQAYRQNSFQDVVLGNANDMILEDLDGDGRPELAVLEFPLDENGKSGPAQVVIYWNSKQDDWKLPDPVRVGLNSPDVSQLEVADLDSDGNLDLVTAGGNRRLIHRDPTTGKETHETAGVLYLRSRGEREWESPQWNSGPPASHFALGDLNGDGLPDLATAQSTAADDAVKLLPGKSDGGFDEDAMIRLPVARASRVALADLDLDSNLDVVVGIDRGPDTYQSDSRIFFGNGRGQFQSADFAIPTAAVSDIVFAGGVDDKNRRMVFCNKIWGRLKEDIPVDVYYGGTDGFSTDRHERFRIRSGYCSNAADINDDGYPDLILASIVHANSEHHPEIGFNILWGSQTGLDDDRRTIVPEYAMTNTNVGDLNRDGYLDLTGSCSFPNNDGEPTRLVIWYGGADGFNPKKRVVLPCDANAPNLIADFNKDGQLDLAVSSTLAHKITFFWGAGEGFDADRRTSLPLLSCDDLNTADLNADGWLDMIVTSFNMPGTLHYDFGAYIFWGSPDGFSPTNAQRLPSSSGCGISVADYDADGYLDINIPNYRRPETRESLSSFLYWGSPQGYSDKDRSSLQIDSGHGSHSADFDGDGLIDLAISCHSRDGDHFTNSRVYYNDGNRFRSPRCQLLPTIGSHYMHRADVGHQYTRKYEQRYESSVWEWSDSYVNARLDWQGDVPGKCQLTFEVRSAPSNETVAAQSWRSVPNGEFEVAAGDRHLQYRATFLSDNGDRYPILDRVQVELR